jgi:hypothetical protein
MQQQGIGYADIVEVWTVAGAAACNQLLADGWVLLGIYPLTTVAEMTQQRTDGEQRNQDIMSDGSFAKRPWSAVKLGRWAGVIVLLRAPVLAVWETVYFHMLGDSSVRSTSPYFIIPFLTALIGQGVWGVIIILLAELVDRMTDYNEE